MNNHTLTIRSLLPYRVSPSGAACAVLLCLGIFAAAPSAANAAKIVGQPLHYYEHTGRDGVHIVEVARNSVATSTLGSVTLWLRSTSSPSTSNQCRTVTLYINNVANQTSAAGCATSEAGAVTFSFATTSTFGNDLVQFRIDLSSAYWSIFSASSTASAVGDCVYGGRACPYYFVAYSEEIPPALPGNVAPEVSCGLTDLGCNIQKAAVWLFWPDSASLENWPVLLAAASSTWPFSYVYELPVFLSELYPTGTSTFSIGVPWHVGNSSTTFVLLSSDRINAVPYTTTFRTLIGYAMWFMTVMTVYALVLRSHNQNTTTS